MPCIVHGAFVDAQSVLRIQALSKTYRSGIAGCTATVRALSDVCVEIRAGEVVGVIGASGSGKTTLLLCAARMLAVDEGIIECRARPMYFRDVLRAKACESHIVLVDNGDLLRGDVAASFALLSLVRRTRETGRALVIAGREETSIKHLADRILRLDRGHLVSTTPGVLLSVPSRVAEQSLR